MAYENARLSPPERLPPLSGNVSLLMYAYVRLLINFFLNPAIPARPKPIKKHGGRFGDGIYFKANNHVLVISIVS
jgi:hypothetical protein